MRRPVATTSIRPTSIAWSCAAGSKPSVAAPWMRATTATAAALRRVLGHLCQLPRSRHSQTVACYSRFGERRDRRRGGGRSGLRARDAAGGRAADRVRGQRPGGRDLGLLGRARRAQLDVRVASYQPPHDLMAFRGFPFDGRGGGDDAWPRFVGHREVRRYLERFADAFDVRARVRFHQRVRTVRPRKTGWSVESEDDRGRRSTNPFDAVAVCSGHYHRPLTPEIEGLTTFEGRVGHSHDYRHPAPYRGRRVAILGAKSSGVDIAGELASIASAVFVCARDHDDPPARSGIHYRAGIARRRVDVWS